MDKAWTTHARIQIKFLGSIRLSGMMKPSLCGIFRTAIAWRHGMFINCANAQSHDQAFLQTLCVESGPLT